MAIIFMPVTLIMLVPDVFDLSHWGIGMLSGAGLDDAIAIVFDLSLLGSATTAGHLRQAASPLTGQILLRW
jgi:hypothetical protein